MLVDSHAHLDDPKFDNDRDAVLQRACAPAIAPRDRLIRPRQHAIIRRTVVRVRYLGSEKADT